MALLEYHYLSIVLHCEDNMGQPTIYFEFRIHLTSHFQPLTHHPFQIMSTRVSLRISPLLLK